MQDVSCCTNYLLMLFMLVIWFNLVEGSESITA